MYLGETNVRKLEFISWMFKQNLDSYKVRELEFVAFYKKLEYYFILGTFASNFHNYNYSKIIRYPQLSKNFAKPMMCRSKTKWTRQQNTRNMYIQYTIATYVTQLTNSETRSSFFRWKLGVPSSKRSPHSKQQ